jgi:hypothetical protein
MERCAVKMQKKQALNALETKKKKKKDEEEEEGSKVKKSPLNHIYLIHIFFSLVHIFFSHSISKHKPRNLKKQKASRNLGSLSHFQSINSQ